MELGYLDNKALGGFRSLLLPNVVVAMDVGEPILALGVQEDDLACGALAGQVLDGTFHVTSFYVAPAYRRRGFGKRLMQTLIALLNLELDSPPVFSVQVQFTATLKEHDVLSLFLEALDFTLEPDHGRNVYLFSADKVAPVLASGEVPAGVTSFAHVQEEALRLATNTALAAGIPLPEASLASQELDLDVSMAIVSGGRVEAFAAFDFSCGGRLTLASLWSGDAGSMAPVLLLRGALCAIRSKYSPDTELAVQTVNAASAALVAALLPEASPISRTYARPLEMNEWR